MSIDAVTNINVSLVAPFISEDSAEIVMITGRTAVLDVNEVITCATLEDVEDAGFSTSDPEYLAATSLRLQGLLPPTFKIGRLGAQVAQVDTITPAAFADGTYTVTITMPLGATVTYAFVGAGMASVNDVVTGLKNLIDAGTQPIATTGSVATLILTAENAGQAFTVTVATTGSTLALVHTTPNTGYRDLLDDLEAVDAEWYGHYASMDRTKDQAAERAIWFETHTMRRLNLEQSAEADLLAGTDTNIAKLLKTIGYKRTIVLYYSGATDHGMAGVAGDRLSVDLDDHTTTWAHKTITGTAVDVLTTTQQAAIEADGANYYVKVGEAGSFYPGQTPVSGIYIDAVTSADWLHRSLTALHRYRFQQISNQGRKIPPNAKGIGIIENDARGIF